MEQQIPHRRRLRRRRVRATLLGALIVAALAIFTKPTQVATMLPGASPTPPPEESVLQKAGGALQNAQPGMWTVTRDIDGDTIDVQQGSTHERVRLLGIDTPETHDPRKPVQCFGEAAAAHTKALLEGKHVRLEADPTDSDRDKYHRLLRYVYLPDGTLVNAELVRDGYAFAYTIFPLEKLDEFRAIETEARTANRGLWAGCNVDASSDIKQTAGAK